MNTFAVVCNYTLDMRLLTGRQCHHFISLTNNTRSHLTAKTTEMPSLHLPDVNCIPLSALDGDNVVEKSERTPWYEGI